MSMLNMFRGWPQTDARAAKIIRTYSVTSDILSYKRCRRQYGFFGVRGFLSSSATQRYFGTMVHDVLDRIYRVYRREGSMPSPEDITAYVEQAHVRLIQSGIRAVYTAQQKRHINLILSRFVDLVGAVFFRHIQGTEFVLERSIRDEALGLDFVLNGTVDVMAGPVSHELGLDFVTSPGDVEIWDYKSGKRPAAGSRQMENYTYQMSVYAELYRQQTGVYPARCVLVFINELGDESMYRRCQHDIRQFSRLLHVIHPDERNIPPAMADFKQTVAEIEAERDKPFERQWQAPEHPVDADTCALCELRYQCEKFAGRDEARRTPLG